MTSAVHQLVVAILLTGVLYISLREASAATVDSVVADIVRKHNTNPKLDDMTASSSAVANGHQITFRNVLRVKKGLSTQQLAGFRSSLVEEVVKPACMANTETFKFAKDLSYRFLYENTYGERLAELNVNVDVCSGRQAP